MSTSHGLLACSVDSTPGTGVDAQMASCASLAEACSEVGQPCCGGLICVAQSNGGRICVDEPPPSPADMSVLPPANHLILAGGFLLADVTTDDHVIAYDLSSKPLGAVVAVPIRGGGSTIIAGADAADWILVRNHTVFLWGKVNGGSGVGEATAWSTGQKSAVALPGATSSLAGLGDATADGALLFYSANAVADGSALDLFVAPADGSSRTRIAAGALIGADCSSGGQFLAGSTLLVLACGLGDNDPQGNAGHALWLVDGGTGKITVLSGSAGGHFELASPDGSWVIADDAKGAAWLYATSGGAPVLLDADAADGFFTPDGSAFVYRTSKGALRRATVGAKPVVTTLVMTGVNVLPRCSLPGRLAPAISPEGEWALVSSARDSQTGISDLSLVSTVAPGVPVVLAAAGKGVLFGPAFTGDGRFVLFADDPKFTGAGLVGSLEVAPVTGGAPAQVGKSVWMWNVTLGPNIVYNDDFKSGKFNGRGDLHAARIDLSPPDVATLAAQAEVDFLMSTNGQAVIFAVNSTMPAGIYAVPLVAP